MAETDGKVDGEEMSKINREVPKCQQQIANQIAKIDGRVGGRVEVPRCQWQMAEQMAKLMRGDVEVPRCQ